MPETGEVVHTCERGRSYSSNGVPHVRIVMIACRSDGSVQDVSRTHCGPRCLSRVVSAKGVWADGVQVRAWCQLVRHERLLALSCELCL